jgi:hypothetical protein
MENDGASLVPMTSSRAGDIATAGGLVIWAQAGTIDARVASAINEKAPHDDQYTLRRTTVARGATTTGRRTTTAARGTAATQPARYTPAAQTTAAFAPIVLRATKPPSSNSEMIKTFMTILPELRRKRSASRKRLD